MTEDHWELEKKCECHGGPIENKMGSSQYCSDCGVSIARLRKEASTRLQSLRNRFRNRFGVNLEEVLSDPEFELRKL